MSGKGAEDDLDDLVNSIEGVTVGGQEKKKKKKNKKKKDENEAEINGDKAATDGVAESVGNGTEDDQANKKKKPKKKKGAVVQTEPPTIPVRELFPSGQFPVGQIMDHPLAQTDTTAKDR
jgi:methionyl aminopeptidase